MSSKPVIVIGLDGATWRLLDRWIEDGKLPTIEQIKSQSVWSVQESCLPPVTSPNWKCFSTGKNPGKLGVYWWEIVDVREQKINIPDSRSFKSAEIFDYLGDADKRWACINMPTTYPPYGADNGGIMVSGGGVTGEQSYTSPTSLETELERRFDYKVSPNRDLDEDGAVDEVVEMIDTRFDVAEWLIDSNDLDYLQISIFLINKLQHYFWDDEQTLKGWQKIDQNLDRFLDAGYDIIFFSDHGSNEIHTEFQINSWLEQEGYLVRDGDLSDEVGSKIGVTQRGLSDLTKKLGIRDFLRKIIPQRFINRIPKQGYKKMEKLENLNWEQTKAIGSGQGLVYLTDPEAPQADELRDEIVGKLRELVEPQTNRPVTRKVYTRDEIYSGKLEYAPDIVFDQAEGIHTEDLVGSSDVFETPTDWRGENERDGIFMSYGPSFQSNKKIESTMITDIVPTVLHLMDLPVPSDVDGDVLEIFDKNASPFSREVSYRDPLPVPSRGVTQQDYQLEDTKENLRELGYLN